MYVGDTVHRVGLGDTIIPRATSVQNSLRSSLERRLRAIDERQVRRDASYEMCSGVIFEVKYFSVCENVRHDIRSFSPCCSWSLSTIEGVSATHATHTPPKQRCPRHIQTVWREGGRGGKVLISSKMGLVSTATRISWCLPKRRSDALCEKTKQHRLVRDRAPVTAAATWYKQYRNIIRSHLVTAIDINTVIHSDAATSWRQPHQLSPLVTARHQQSVCRKCP